VLNRETLQCGELAGVYEELKAIRSVARSSITLKLILETSQLSEEEIIAASVLAGYAGFDFIKTSTGFCGGGATVEHVLLMSKVADVVSQRDDLGDFLGKKMKVKASGGVRSLDEAKRMIEVGAERIGTSSGVQIMLDFSEEGKGGEVDGAAGGY
jgi:deoxyribose-phosphate aldolase